MRRGLTIAASSLLALLTLVTALAPASSGATVPASFTDTLVIDGLSSPRSMDFLPDGRIIVVENNGRFVLASGTTSSDMGTLTGISTSGEQGLLGIAVDPDFPARPYIYTHYTTTNNVQIARFNITNYTGPGPTQVDLASRLILLGDMPNVNTNHNGGTVRFGPDKMLYISIGDDATGGCDAQNLSFMSGKILRIKVDDSVNPSNRATLAPSDNPFFSDPRVNATLVWAYGLRNPFRFDIDPVTGTLYIGDVGQSTWEEIDRVPTGGANLGWPYYEANMTYRGSPCPTDGSIPPAANLTFPIYAFPNTGSAIIVGTIYRGVDFPNDASFPPAYDQNVFYFDFYEDPLHVLRSPDNLTNWSLVAGNDAVDWANGMQYSPDIREGLDGALYWVSEAGELRRISYDSVPQVTTASLPFGTVGVAYSAQVSASGAPTPFTWSVSSGALPQGLNLDTATGVISGSPTAVENASFVIQVNTSAGRSGIRPFTIEVADPVSVTATTLPDATEGATYAAPFAATGGVGAYTWVVDSGSLPAGISLSAPVGHLTGTPTAFGDFTFAIRATDAQGRFGVQPFSLRVIQRLAFTTATLPNGVQAVYYEAALAGVGGIPPYAFAVNASSALPVGILLGATNGTLYGTPGAASSTLVRLDLQDAGGQSVTSTFSLVIAPPAGGPPLITTSSLPDGSVGDTYDINLAAVEGTAPLSWSAETSAFPPGVSFAAGNARIHGTPTTAGSWTFNVTVTDTSARSDTRLFTLTVRAPQREIRITTAALRVGEVGVDYGLLILAFEGTNLSSSIAWSTSSNLAGLILDADGTLHGTPSAEGAFTVVVNVSDTVNAGVEATATFELVITRVSVMTATTPALTVGVGVTLLLSAGGGGPVAWSIVNGSLPLGLVLMANGTITGTPAAAGNYTVTVRAAREGASATNYDDQTLTFTVAGSGTSPPPPPPPAEPGIGLAVALIAVLLVLGALALAMGRRRERDE